MYIRTSQEMDDITRRRIVEGFVSTATAATAAAASCRLPS